MVYTRLLFILFFSISFLSFTPLPIKREMHRIFDSHLNQLKVESNLTPEGTSLSFVNELSGLRIEMIRVVSDGLTIDAARRDILKIVKPIVEEINQNTLIRKYLHTYPFRPDSVYAGVRYLNSSGWFIPTDKVNDVTLMDGRIYYQTYYAQRKLGDQFVGIHSETYQEALEKVNDE